jgi:hypothetical protein
MSLSQGERRGFESHHPLEIKMSIAKLFVCVDRLMPKSDINLTSQEFTSKLQQLNEELRGVREIA